ncbi:helix-turn-helix domain-containing protein [Actinoplanes sp. TBRC 11911]|uniref:helix-turn-helix transcriptional regulator n=1 Tax=Actinoplanes sp. TBRC 11911 TaxID=2729386 RepID=UPI00145CF7EF|nr:helix-turn-helix transcriptional regulator [Actinoplanes sp. TBRC 11911]NMO52885.1 helix-turn-helix domain-containing protein [Actinoplanes sp. TBRC 11911]
MAHNEELSKFLRARRAALSPESADLGGPGRRVPGLRREELASLAGISVDYYTRLEQGRNIAPSDAVLDAIASALRLDPAQRAYLYTVARQSPPSQRRAATKAQSVRPGLLALIDQLGDTPAFVLGRRTDVLAANRMARLLLADFNAMPARDRNAARWLILDEGARSLFAGDWDGVASDMIGMLRMDAARHPDDPKTTALVGELSMKSHDFRRWWADQKVVEFGYGSKTLHHPLVGELVLETEAMTFPADPDQMLIAFLAKPASPSRHALELLDAFTLRG